MKLEEERNKEEMKEWEGEQGSVTPWKGGIKRKKKGME